MRLVTYNVQFGKGRDGRFDLRRIADAVRDADVIALQEVGRHWLRSRHNRPAARAGGAPARSSLSGEREGITCPATGASPDQRIDYCFVSTPLLPRLSACWIDDGAAGSVWTDLDL